MAKSDAVGGCSEAMAEVCQPAAGSALLHECCGERRFHALDQTIRCKSPSVTAEMVVQQVRTELPSCKQKLLCAVAQYWQLE